MKINYLQALQNYIKSFDSQKLKIQLFWEFKFHFDLLFIAPSRNYHQLLLILIVYSFIKKMIIN